MSQTVVLDIEAFGAGQPALNPDLLVEHARVALARYHESPAGFAVCTGADEHPATVVFGRPDPRSGATLERERFVENGAIVMAGIVLNRFERKQITRVLKRGRHVDYFVGDMPDDFRWILEVGGTDERNFTTLRSEKRAQLEGSPYRLPPHSKDGFVSVTRFAPGAVTASDRVRSL